MDRSMIKTNTVISTLKGIVSAVFLIVRNKVFISLNNMVYDNVQKMYDTMYKTTLQAIIKKSDIENEKLSTLSEMWLCFTEFIVLTLLALIAIYIKEKVFIVIFIAEIIAIIYGKNTISKYYEEENK